MKHNVFLNKGGTGNPTASGNIKEWVRTYCNLPDKETVVLVTELNCSKENCPDRETVISILIQSEIKVLKIEKPMKEITTNDIKTVSKEYLINDNKNNK